jgi:hypothetical protein
MLARAKPGATTDDICEELILPLTAEGGGCSYVQHLRRTGKGARVGRATHFVSHTWRYRFADVVEALSVWAVTQSGAPPLFWFDAFVVNQHVREAVDQQWWADAFQRAVRTIGHTLVVMAPWHSPVTVTRAWCL